MGRNKRSGKGSRKPKVSTECNQDLQGGNHEPTKRWTPSEFDPKDPADLIRALVAPYPGNEKTSKVDNVPQVFDIKVDARVPAGKTSALTFELDALATQKKQLEVMASKVKDLQAEQERTRFQALQWLADQESSAKKAAALAEELGAATAKIASLEVERDAWLQEKEALSTRNAELANQLAESNAETAELAAVMEAMEEELDDLRMSQHFRHASGGCVMSSKDAYELGCADTKAKMTAAQPTVASPIQSSQSGIAAFPGFPVTATVGNPRISSTSATEMVVTANKGIDRLPNSDMSLPALVPTVAPKEALSPTSGRIVHAATGLAAVPSHSIEGPRMEAKAMTSADIAQAAFNSGPYQSHMHATDANNVIPYSTGFVVVTPKLVRPGVDATPRPASNPSLLDMIQMPYEEGKAALTRARVPFRDNPAPPPTYFVVTPKCTNPGVGSKGPSRPAGAKGWSTGTVFHK